MWRRDKENFEGLAASAQSVHQFMASDFDPSKLTADNGVCERLKIENQEQENSCAGHMITTLCEADILMASNFKVDIQLSRAFAYAEGQRKCGLIGRDQGCSIYGVIEAAGDGLCQEKYAQYTGQYYTKFKPDAYKDRVNQQLKSWVKATNVLQVYQFLMQRNGGLALGINWNDSCRNLVNGKIVNWRQQLDWRGNAVGGLHAVPIVGIDPDVRDDNGWPFFKLPNSWSKSYGINGVARVEPKSLQSMLDASLTAAYLVSGMTYIKPRFNWETARFFK